MIRLREIQSALMPVVGWRQSYNPDNAIDEDLTASESGLTFQGAHPLVTIENVRAIMPDDYLYKYPAWKDDAAYAVGAKVRHGGKVWKAVAANTGSEPSEQNSDWTPFNFLSDYIRHLTEEGINTAVQQFLQMKTLGRETKDLLVRRTFFDGAARLQNFLTPTGKIVGFEIVPVRALGVTMKIERIGLQMIGGTGPVRLYLFHSSQYAPVRVIDVEFTNTSGGFQWFEFADLYLPYISGGTDSGGAWFLCYDQNDLPRGMRALNVTRDWSKEPCQTCFGYGLDGWKEITKYMQVSPFCTAAPEDFREDPAMFDIGRVAYTNTQNYGLNCEVSVGCDLTDFIIRERAVFATVIQRQVAASVLRTLAMNPDVRVNRNQVNVTREQLLYELDGAVQGRASGLGFELRRAYEALKIDTQGLDRICLKCENHGVRYGVV